MTIDKVYCSKKRKQSTSIHTCIPTKEYICTWLEPLDDKEKPQYFLKLENLKIPIRKQNSGEMYATERGQETNKPYLIIKEKKSKQECIEVC